MVLIKIGSFMRVSTVDILELIFHFIFISDMDEAKKCMKWICNYIEFQANKPAPFHVRDLHSIIVAAFNCLSQWILNHHWLLNDDVSHKVCSALCCIPIELFDSTDCFVAPFAN